MHLVWIELRDFRNHVETRVDLPPGLSVVVGPNGEGKTNLLEAMYYLLALTSPRVGSDVPLVRHGAASAYVRGEVQTGEGRVLIEVEVRGSGANRVHVNRSVIRRKGDLRRRVRGVFFEPDDLAIGQGDPGRRRRFMDDVVVALWPAREAAGRAYDKALRQRNRLLKDWEGAPGGPPGLDVWTRELIEAGAAVTRARAEAVGRVTGPSEEEFGAQTNEELSVTYRPSVEEGASVRGPSGMLGPPGTLEEAFRARLALRHGDELIRRTTLVGPHRDELDLAVRTLTVRAFASHGEAWAAALSLRLGMARAVGAEVGEPPVTLLDDPFSGLDPTRRRRVAGSLQSRGQVVVSVADPTEIPAGAEAVWEVRGGSVSPPRSPGRGGGEPGSGQ